MNHATRNRPQASTGRFPRLCLLSAMLAILGVQTLHGADTPAEQGNSRSASGLDFYSQGGVVVDGVAYFTANDYSIADWPGPFGDPQTNQMAVAEEVDVTLATLEEIVPPQNTADGDDRPNLAEGAVIVAQSRIQGEQSNVAHMLDGDPQTRWATNRVLGSARSA